MSEESYTVERFACRPGPGERKVGIEAAKKRRRRNYKTIPLEHAPRLGRSICGDTTLWDHAAPFVMSKLGILIHRTRHVTTFRASWGSHTNATYWCNSSTNRPLFIEQPGELLLCERCEALAQAAGMHSAETLVGRHVHIGVLRPVRLCCRNDNN